MMSHTLGRLCRSSPRTTLLVASVVLLGVGQAQAQPLSNSRWNTTYAVGNNQNVHAQVVIQGQFGYYSLGNSGQTGTLFSIQAQPGTTGGTVIQGQWSHNADHGQFVWYLTPDNSQFSGQWKSDNGATGQWWGTALVSGSPGVNGGSNMLGPANGGNSGNMGGPSNGNVPGNGGVSNGQLGLMPPAAPFSPQPNFAGKGLGL